MDDLWIISVAVAEFLSLELRNKFEICRYNINLNLFVKLWDWMEKHKRFNGATRKKLHR